MDALETAIATLRAKAPDDVDACRQTVLGVAQAVGDAKGGITAVEAAMIEEIRKMVGSA